MKPNDEITLKAKTKHGKDVIGRVGNKFVVIALAQIVSCCGGGAGARIVSLTNGSDDRWLGLPEDKDFEVINDR